MRKAIPEPEGFSAYRECKIPPSGCLLTTTAPPSKKKGQFGPRFIRLKIPGTTQIGIHGTCAPWSIGHRVRHG